jgi:arginyl-tRNA synthetase
MEYQKEIAKLIASALEDPTCRLERDPAILEALLEVPKESSLGDIAFPCFTLAKELREAPPKIAQRLAGLLTERLTSVRGIRAVHATGPYLNFFLATPVLAEDLLSAIRSGAFLAVRPPTGDRVMVEYSQPNTHKAFHVGHIRSAVLGDSIARILGWLGHDVIPTNYLGDEGTHVAKCLWYLTTRFHGEIPEHNRGEFLGVLYSEANRLLELETYTTAPFPGIIAARVLEVTPHPAEPKWMVLRLDCGQSEKTVVSAATGYVAGDVVAYAPPGYRMAGRVVGILEKKGITSEGMITSERELGFSDDNDRAVILPDETVPGTEIVEVFRVPDALPSGDSVLATVRAREQEVSRVLCRIEDGEASMRRLWEDTKEWSLEEFREIYRWLDCTFEHYFFESEFGSSGKDLVRAFQEQGVFVQSEGAVGADLSQWNLGFCVLIKRDGTALYATRDLALAKKKFEEFNVSHSIYVVDSAQTFHFQQVFKCLELMGFPHANDCVHVGFAQVVRPDGKMSSRKGNVILFSELKRRLLEKVMNEFLEKYRGEWSDEEINETAGRIALATMRYGMLNQDNSSQVVFDLDEWTSRSGNTGPYMLYACARISSILRDASHVDRSTVQWDLLRHDAEKDLLLHLRTYSEVVARAGQNFTPHLIAAFVYELSKRFSRFYHECSVLNAETDELKASRLVLVEGVYEVLEAALGLLGIQTVARM